MSEIKDAPNTTLDPKLRALLDDESEAQRGDYIYCAACSAIITRAQERTAVHGSHDHTCTNPHGFEFHIGCFAQALGCAISGPEYAADSWFMGYSWQLAACAECKTHLGWYFSANAGHTGSSASPKYFYGLILDRIQEDS